MKPPRGFFWRREWQPTPGSLPGESPGQRNLAGYSPWGHKELARTEQLSTGDSWANKSRRLQDKGGNRLRVPKRRRSPGKARFILALHQQACATPGWGSAATGRSVMVKEPRHPGVRGLWSTGAQGSGLGPSSSQRPQTMHVESSVHGCMDGEESNACQGPKAGTPHRRQIFIPGTLVVRLHHR